ncbi:hypothetical protein [Halorussus sp. AFM4]|uniref:hypothetical protein n=1 Tax=Halorussus sp. AFM4 TaxID=3421651 RepID=UPI003EB855E4
MSAVRKRTPDDDASDVRRRTVEELEKQHQTLTLHDFVRIVEAHHSDDGGGVERDLLAAHAAAVYFGVDVSEIDDRLAPSDEWTDADEFYELDDDRVSAYPPKWHEVVSDTDDLLDLIELVQAGTDEPAGKGPEAVAKQGVNQELVLRVAETVADIDRDEARQRLNELRRAGEIEQYPD